MLKRAVVLPFLSLFLGGISFVFLTSYHNIPITNQAQNSRPEISDDSSSSSTFRDQATEREEIAYEDERDRDILDRARRMGDWGYRENWRYDRKAFFRGDTQGEAYVEEHPYGPAGIGYSADNDYLRLYNFYNEEMNRKRQEALSKMRPGNSYRPFE